KVDHEMACWYRGRAEGDDRALDPPPRRIERPHDVADPERLHGHSAARRLDQRSTGQADRTVRRAGRGLLLDLDGSGGRDRARRAQALAAARPGLGEVVEAVGVVADRIEGNRPEDLPGLVDGELLGIREGTGRAHTEL